MKSQLCGPILTENGSLDLNTVFYTDPAINTMFEDTQLELQQTKEKLNDIQTAYQIATSAHSGDDQYSTIYFF